MRYTAASVVEAFRWPVIRIGPSDATLNADRRWWGRVYAWFIRHCRTWTPKPLSVPQMLTLQAAKGDPAAYFVALRPVLRAVLPWRWWYRLVGDPVRLILRLPKDLLTLVLQAIVTAPGSDTDVSQEEDGLAILARLQRAAVRGPEAPRGVSLTIAALTVRATYGDTWFYNPSRWPTSDGYVPFAVCLMEYAGVQTLEVRRRIEVADGWTLAHGPASQKRQMERLAYPTEVC